MRRIRDASANSHGGDARPDVTSTADRRTHSTYPDAVDSGAHSRRGNPASHCLPRLVPCCACDPNSHGCCPTSDARARADRRAHGNPYSRSDNAATYA